MKTFAGEERTTTTGTVTVEYTPSQWIENRVGQYRHQLNAYTQMPTAREQAIMDFLDIYLRGEFK
jgi:hypothetical protein